MYKLFKRDGKYHIDATIRGKRVRRSLKTSDRKKAEEKAEELFKELIGATEPKKHENEGMLSAMIERTYIDKWLATNSSEADNSLRKAKECMSHIKDRPVKDITNVDIAALKKALKYDKNGKERKLSTVNRYLSALSTVLYHSEYLGYLDKVPKVRKYKEDNLKLIWYTEEQKQTIIEKAYEVDELYGDLFIVLFYTGVRVSVEGLELRTSNVKGDYLTMIGKGGKSRALKMVNKVKEVIQKRCKIADPADDLLFPTDRYKTAKVLRNIRLTYLPELDDRYDVHTMRHTFASELVQRGVDLYRVQHLMGHEHYSTTARYAHLRPDIADAVDILEG